METKKELQALLKWAKKERKEWELFILTVEQKIKKLNAIKNTPKTI